MSNKPDKTAEQIMAVSFPDEELRHIHCSAYIDRGGGIGTYCDNKPKWRRGDELYCTLHRPEGKQMADKERVCAECKSQTAKRIKAEIEKSSVVCEVAGVCARNRVIEESWWQQFWKPYVGK